MEPVSGYRPSDSTSNYQEVRAAWHTRILTKLSECGRVLVSSWQLLVSKIQKIANDIFSHRVVVEKDSVNTSNSGQTPNKSLDSIPNTDCKPIDPKENEKIQTITKEVLPSIVTTPQDQPLSPLEQTIPTHSDRTTDQEDTSLSLHQIPAKEETPTLLETNTNSSLNDHELALLQKVLGIWRKKPMPKSQKSFTCLKWKFAQKKLSAWGKHGVHEGVFRLYFEDYSGEYLTEQHFSKSQMDFRSYENYWNKNKQVLQTHYKDIWAWIEHLETHPQDRPKQFKFPTKKVVYIHAPTDRRKFLATSKDGLLYQAGSLVQDTQEYAAVVGLDGQFYVNIKERDVFQHSSFFAGKPVLSACCFHAKDGKISEIFMKSGHYLYESLSQGDRRAQIYAALKIVQVLMSMKVDLSKTKLYSDPVVPELFGKKNWSPVKFFEHYNTFTDVITSTEKAIAEKIQGSPIGSWILWKKGSKQEKLISFIEQDGTVHHRSVSQDQILEDLVRTYGMEKQIKS